MKSIKSTKWLAVLALTTVAMAAQDGSLLRRELKVGASETYKVKSEVKHSFGGAMGDMGSTSTTEATVDVITTKVDEAKGIAEVETVTKIDRHQQSSSFNGQTENSNNKPAEPKKEKGTLDSRNRLAATNPFANAFNSEELKLKLDELKKLGSEDLKGVEDLGNLNLEGLISSLEKLGPLDQLSIGNLNPASLLTLIELPEKPAKIGDTFEMNVPAAISQAVGGLQDVKLKMRFAEEKMVNGRLVWVVRYSGDLKMNLDTNDLLSQLGQASELGSLKVTRGGDIKGEGYVDKLTGKTVANTMLITSETKMSMGQLGEFPNTTSLLVKVSLVQ